jgi:hypothetical protein
MEPSITNIQAARDNTSLLTQINKNGFTFSFSFVYECMFYKTLELTDWQAQKVCPSKVLTDFSIGLYSQQKLLTFSHCLLLNNANKPKAATTAAPAATA